MLSLRSRAWLLAALAVGVMVIVGGLLLSGSDSDSDAGRDTDVRDDGQGPPAPAEPVSLADTFGVFRSGGADPAVYDKYEAWLGAEARFVLLSGSRRDWDSWRDTIDGHLTSWPAEEATAILSLPMAVERRLGDSDTGDVHAGAAGRYDAHWKWLGNRLREHADRLASVGVDLTDHVVLRPGWEHNAPWYPHSSSAEARPDQGRAADPSRPAAFVDYWKRIHALVMGPLADGGYDVRWDWNVARTGSQEDAEAAFPDGTSPVDGGPYVDVVTLDVYDANGPYGNLYPPTNSTTRLQTWTLIETTEISLDWLEQFADLHTEGRLGIDEWGLSHQIRSGREVGGGDNALFVREMHEWLTDQADAGRLQWHLYFDQDADDGLHRLSPGREFDFSEASAEFRRRFGSTG